MLKQANNKVTIEGILSEVDIKTGTTKENPDNPAKSKRDYASGNIKVKVTQEVNGKTEENEIPVRLFAMKNKNDGNPNPAYDNIIKIQETMTSIAACGNEDEATRVRITTGSIVENAYYSQAGNLVSMPQINASFVQAIKKDDCHPKADFDATIVVGSIKEEIRDEVETGRLIVKGLLVQYGEKVDAVDFIVASTGAVNHIKTYWNEGDTVEIAGKVNFTSKTIRREKSVGFGDPIIEERTISARELTITSGSEEGFDEEQAYDATEIKKALAERQARIEASKKKEAAKPASGSSFGF